MDDLPSKIAKNELLHETLCRLVENFEISINPRWPPHDVDLFDLENGQGQIKRVSTEIHHKLRYYIIFYGVCFKNKKIIFPKWPPDFNPP